MPHSPEILAPAGSMAALLAAVRAGADAVYVGLRELNARRGAKNFSAEELHAAVKVCHEANVKVYLTLNILVKPRELTLAARALAIAKSAGVDAVLAADPAVILLAKTLGIALHISTQAGISSPAGVRAAKLLGATRVVLARECSLAEILACQEEAQRFGVEVEIFVQGALCLSSSGRCLASSWVGGRSGNRGACASPCRALWTQDSGESSRCFSTHDLSALPHAAKLLHIASWKIEGRLKTPTWVEQTVRVWHAARASALGAPISRSACKTASEASPKQSSDISHPTIDLGAYTGRQQDCAYLEGRTADLIGVSGRSAQESPTPGTKPQLSISISRGPKGWDFLLDCEGHEERFTLPASVVKREGVDTHELQTRLLLPNTWDLAPINAPDDFLIPRRLVPQIQSIVTTGIKRHDQPKTRIEGELPDILRPLLTPRPAHPDNRRRYRLDGCDQARIESHRAAAFQSQHPNVQLLIEFLGLPNCTRLESFISAVSPKPVVVLPAIHYAGDEAAIRNLCENAVKNNLLVEINSFDTWVIAKESGATFCVGPGLAVLNPVSANFWQDQGAQWISASPESDRTMLRDLVENSPLPVNITLMGRPPLFLTRAQIPGGARKDRRDLHLAPHQLSGGITAWRSLLPFDWRNADGIAPSAHLCIDLLGSPDPHQEWGKPVKNAGTFNLERELQ